MIAKGNLHGDGAKLALYLVTGKEGERAELIELRGFPTDDIRDAFIAAQLGAEAKTQSTRPFFHTYVRLLDGESLSRDQWQYVADRIEKQLGFDNQPRALAFHHLPDGATHLHIAWSRHDLEHDVVIDPGLYKLKLKEISRQLERELGLTIVRNERAPEQKTLSPGRNEFEQARRLGTDLKEIRETIRDCWERSDNGRSFEAALAEHGYILARGDRRDFVVVDPAGGDHALGKRITGSPAAETRARLGDIDKALLPSVDQAKAMQAERARLNPEIAPQRRPAGIMFEAPIAAEVTSPAFTAAARATTAPEAIQTREAMTAPSAPEPEQAAPTSAARDAMREPEDIASRFAGGMFKALGAVFEALASMVAPPPPKTPDQQRRDAEAAGERDEFRRFVAEQSKALYIVNEQSRDQQRQREQEEHDRDARRLRDDRQR